MMTSVKDCGSDWGSEAASWKNHVHHHTYLSAPMIFSLQNIWTFLRKVCMHQNNWAKTTAPDKI
jgi:hypothetical protein